MQLPVAAAPGVLLIVRKKCNLLRQHERQIYTVHAYSVHKEAGKH